MTKFREASSLSFALLVAALQTGCPESKTSSESMEKMDKTEKKAAMPKDDMAGGVDKADKKMDEPKGDMDKKKEEMDKDEEDDDDDGL